jgi:hypothetical protein
MTTKENDERAAHQWMLANTLMVNLTTTVEGGERAAHQWMLANTEAALSGGTKAEKALVELLLLTRTDEQERIGRLLHEAAKANDGIGATASANALRRFADVYLDK